MSFTKQVAKGVSLFSAAILTGIAGQALAGSLQAPAISSAIMVAPPTETFLYDFSLSPAGADKNHNSLVTYQWSLESNSRLYGVERKITLNGRCIDPGTGKASTNGQCWWDWDKLHLASEQDQYGYTYTYSTQINPAQGYANWDEGDYVISTRAADLYNGYSNVVSLNFKVYDSSAVDPTLSDFSLSPSKISKSDTSYRRFTYGLTANSKISQFPAPHHQKWPVL